MQTYPAERTEILRSERKDEEYIDNLHERISSVTKELAGDVVWIKVYKHLRPISKLIYYGRTSLLGVQTLGEEYMSLVPVKDQQNPEESSLLQKIVFILTESFGAEVINNKLDELRANDEKYFSRQMSLKQVPIGRVILSALLKSLNFSTIQRLHWAVFYLFGGKFYSIWKRISNIQFVSLRPETNIRMNTVFKVIGSVSILMFILSNAIKIRREVLKRKRSRIQNDQDQIPASEDGAFFCDICLNSGDPICTPCGHVFCFDCIISHSESADLEANKGLCPQCRFEFLLRTVIPLLNL